LYPRRTLYGLLLISEGIGRMRILLVSILAIGAFIGHPTAAQAQANTLTGEMAYANALVGGPWNCTTAIPAMMGQPAHTDQVTVTFEVVPGNVYHDHVASSTYVGDDYFGYSSKMKMYWSTSTDNQGGHGSATSTDAKTYTGTSAMGPMNMNVTSTYGIASASSISLHQVISGNGQQLVFDSNCTR
jgi:hypothetical protein